MHGNMENGTKGKHFLRLSMLLYSPCPSEKYELET